MHMLSLILLWWAFDFLKWLNMKFNFFLDQWLLIKPQYLKAHRKFQRLQFCFVDINLATFSLFTFIQGNLSEQGKLIMQGSFQMSTEHKGKMKDLRFKPMQRQMFLHQKSILLCKRREDLNSTDKVIYSFKNLLKVRVRGSWTQQSVIGYRLFKKDSRYNQICLVGGLWFNF